MSYAIDDYIAVGNYRGLLNITIILIILLTSSGIFQYLHTYLSGWLGQYIIKDIRIRLYEHLLKMQLKFFDKTPIGRLVTRNVSDIETLSEVFSQGLAALIADVLQLAFILILHVLSGLETNTDEPINLSIAGNLHIHFQRKNKESFQ